MSELALVSSTPELPEEPFARAWIGVCAWRGRCLNVFANAESDVTEALRLRAPDGRVPRLAGQRTKALLDLAAKEASSAWSTVRAALGDWQAHESKRAWVAHGTFSALLDRHGRWSAVVRFVSVDKGGSTEQRLVFTEAEAREFEQELKTACNKLRTKLQKLPKGS